ncbi:glucokinase [Oceanobacter mangrovi]|uniref:glucokinase n=1 Tax=Oceanobacter mangrovi TaxID=2862510 RepID=UPI001FE346CF|nr:glucokinase [Oceanobacter mangrovi]
MALAPQHEPAPAPVHDPVQASLYDAALVADIGGTNARFALVEAGSLELQQVMTLATASFANIDDAIHFYLQQAGAPRVQRACLALACPVEQDPLSMTNSHWCFSRAELQTRFGWQQLRLVNDFTAMALAMLHLDDDDLVEIHRGQTIDGAPRLVIGPGTGLGVSALIPVGCDWYPLSSEGGHVSFAPTNQADLKIWQAFRQRYPRLSVERLLSGQGLLELYQLLVDIESQPRVCETAAEVTGLALQQGCPLALASWQHFLAILGAVVGDHVLTLGARGGVYLCGGILPRVQPLLADSNFIAAMINKGRYQSYLEAVPVWLCSAENPGLVGAAVALDNPLLSR